MLWCVRLDYVVWLVLDKLVSEHREKEIAEVETR